MSPIESIILGVVEGITEFLPISSTGHLILVSELLGLAQDNFHKSFEIIIQLGAIASVVVLYWRSFLQVEILKKLFVAFIPTAAVGLLLYSFIKTFLIGNERIVLFALFFGGIALILFEFWHKAPTPKGRGPDQSVGKKVAEDITYKQSLLIGLAQAVAVIPGISRSAATILGGLALGINRTTIVEFSFLLAVPTMLAATGLDLLKNASTFSTDQFGVLAIGFAVSFVVALISIKFLLNFVRRYSFVSFGVYRIAVAVVFWFILI